MERLVAEWAQAFRSRTPLHLALHRTKSGLYLRWRRSGRRGDQPYLRLDDGEGARILSQVPAEFRRVLWQFDRQMLWLNLQLSLARQESRLLVTYLEQIQRRKSLLNQHGVSAGAEAAPAKQSPCP